MGAVETRAFIQAGGDAYLCPLSEIHIPLEVLEGYLAPVWLGQQPLTRITRVAASGTRACMADGDERLEPVTAVVAGKAVRWRERRLVVRVAAAGSCGGSGTAGAAGEGAGRGDRAQ